MLTYLYLIAGLALLILGGDYLVKGGVAVAKRFKVPSLIIGMTIVAFGTSSPEFIVSLQSALQGHPEISLGNVVGSNIFNILFVIGCSALITPIENFDFTAFSFDFYWMIIFAAFLALTVIPFERIAKKIKDEKIYSIVTRFEGFFLIAAYAVYVILLLN